jgi:hypothetical protein
MELPLPGEPLLLAFQSALRLVVFLGQYRYILPNRIGTIFQAI